MPTHPEFIRLGQIVGAHGLKGQVKVHPLTQFLDSFAPGVRLKMGDDWVEIKESQLHKNRLLLKLVGVTDRNAAEALQWAYLEGKPEDVELEDDEYRTEDLIGLEVFTIEGEALGKIDEVLPLPAQDVLKVGEILIPAVKEFVKSIDLKKKKVVVELIPGMQED